MLAQIKNGVRIFLQSFGILFKNPRLFGFNLLSIPFFLVALMFLVIVGRGAFVGMSMPHKEGQSVQSETPSAANAPIEVQEADWWFLPIAQYSEKAGATPKNIEYLRQNFWWFGPLVMLFVLLCSSFMYIGLTQLSMSILTRRKMPFWGVVRLALYGMFSPSLWGLITMNSAVMFLVQLGGLGLADLMRSIALVFFSASMVVQINSKVGALAAIRRATALITARLFDVIGILVMFFVFNIAESFLARAGLRVGGLWEIIFFNVAIITMCRFYLFARK